VACDARRLLEDPVAALKGPCYDGRVVGQFDV
jgi:hypothetical protein